MNKDLSSSNPMNLYLFKYFLFKTYYQDTEIKSVIFQMAYGDDAIKIKSFL